MFSAPKGSEGHGNRSRSGGGDHEVSVLAAGLRIAGSLETDGFLRVEGRVKGDLKAQGQVLVSPGGVVEGDIRTRHAIVAGEVHGHVFADESVELKAGCHVIGDIATPRISIEEGGKVDGQLQMGAAKKQITAHSAKPQPAAA
jgi:cytoskeletal protein CcmA (bactofilin family)